MSYAAVNRYESSTESLLMEPLAADPTKRSASPAADIESARTPAPVDTIETAPAGPASPLLRHHPSQPLSPDERLAQQLAQHKKDAARYHGPSSALLKGAAACMVVPSFALYAGDALSAAGRQLQALRKERNNAREYCLQFQDFQWAHATSAEGSLDSSNAHRPPVDGTWGTRASYNFTAPCLHGFNQSDKVVNASVGNAAFPLYFGANETLSQFVPKPALGPFPLTSPCYAIPAGFEPGRITQYKANGSSLLGSLPTLQLETCFAPLQKVAPVPAWDSDPINALLSGPGLVSSIFFMLVARKFLPAKSGARLSDLQQAVSEARYFEQPLSQWRQEMERAPFYDQRETATDERLEQMMQGRLRNLLAENVQNNNLPLLNDIAKPVLAQETNTALRRGAVRALLEGKLETLFDQRPAIAAAYGPHLADQSILERLGAWQPHRDNLRLLDGVLQSPHTAGTARLLVAELAKKCFFDVGPMQLKLIAGEVLEGGPVYTPLHSFEDHVKSKPADARAQWLHLLKEFDAAAPATDAQEHHPLTPMPFVSGIAQMFWQALQQTWQRDGQKVGASTRKLVIETDVLLG